MKLNKIILAVLFSQPLIHSNVYINEIINQTHEKITLEYLVPMFAKEVIEDSTKYRINPLRQINWNAEILPGGKLKLQNAYLPIARTTNDYVNVVIFRIGNTNFQYKQNELCRIRMIAGVFDKISPMGPQETNILPNLIPGQKINIIIRETKSDIYYADYHTAETRINFESIKIDFIKA